MGKIPSNRLQEVLFGSSDKSTSAQISSLEKQGLIKRIAPRIYTSKLNDDPAIIIKRNWFHILASQYPDALLSHRSALEFKPTPGGHVYLTYTYTHNVQLPGLTIHFLEGKGRIEGDVPLFENLYVSQEARAYLENMEPTRKNGEESKSLSQEEIEEKLETIIRVKGEDALNKLRDTARAVSGALEMEKEFNKLNKIISAILSTGVSKNLKSTVARARVLGDPFDQGRIELFENLYQELAGKEFPEYIDKNKTEKSYRSFAFFEGYFSNYIEGTEFTVDEAKDIILTETPMAARDEDSHDILGTYQIVADKNEMSRVPSTAAEFINLLRERHAVLLRARLSKKPGEFKTKNNRAGSTEFVEWELVTGTLNKGFEWYSMLRHPFAKAAYIMFLVSEVHPFLDGNGRMARVMMNAELSSKGYSKIIIPNVFREDYILSLKKFTKDRTSDAYIRMLLRAYEFSANVFNEDLDAMEIYLSKCEAFKEPKEGKLKIIAH
jgi:prophage maintenance system killer protein